MNPYLSYKTFTHKMRRIWIKNQKIKNILYKIFSFFLSYLKLQEFIVSEKTKTVS